jgi:hypothetical protein
MLSIRAENILRAKGYDLKDFPAYLEKLNKELEAAQYDPDFVFKRERNCGRKTRNELIDWFYQEWARLEDIKKHTKEKLEEALKVNTIPFEQILIQIITDGEAREAVVNALTELNKKRIQKTF